MGVTGLWSVLDGQQAGRPVHNLDSLKGQRLAVDASIWLYQLSRVTIKNTHSRHAFIAAGIYRRLAKLCHFGVLPVFVFDGMPPLLKREELKRRQVQRGKSEADVRKIAERILQAKLKLLAAGGNAKSSSVDGKVVDDDVFKLKPLPEQHNSDHDDIEYEEYDSDEEDGDEAEEMLRQIDINSASFKRLPEDLQLELLYQLKERVYFDTTAPARQYNAEIVDPRHFTNHQIEAIKKRHAITASIDRLKRGLTAANYFDDDQGMMMGDGEKAVKARKIASSDQRAFILVKNEGHGYTLTPGAYLADNQKNQLDDKEDDGKPVGDSEEEFMAAFFGEPSDIVTPVMNIVPQEHMVAPTKESVRQEAYVEETEDRKVRETISESVITEEKAPVYEKSEQTTETKFTRDKMVLNTSSKVPEKREPIEAVKIPSSPVKIKEPEIKSEESLPVAKPTLSTTVPDQELIVDLQRELSNLQQEHSNKSLQTETLSSEVEQLFRDFLDAFGFPWMVAISEAEAQCANLYLTGSVDGIITDDVDVFLFGGDNVYRHFFKNKATPLYYRLNRDNMVKLSRDDLIILSLFLGGDYGPGVTGYGPKKATALLDAQSEDDKQGSVHERVSRLRLCTKAVDAYELERALSSDIVDAYLNPAVETIHYDRLRWGPIDKKRISALLKRQAGWGDIEIERSLKNLVKL